MKESRELKKLLILIKKISEKESLSITYIFNNLDKVSNLYNLSITEEEKRLLRKFQNKNYGHLKKPLDINSFLKPKFEQ